MNNLKKILLIDFCNFEDYPIGGQLSFVKNLMLSFNNELILIGITTDTKDPVGKWFKKEIKGITYDFFAFARFEKTKTKHILPDRLVSFLLLKYYGEKIKTIKINNIFIQRPEILLAVKNFKFKNVCYRFAGLENPLKISKYWFSRYFSNYFDKIFFSSLKSVKKILATGNEEAINEMIVRSKGEIENKHIIKFPTRINTQIFKKLNKNDTRLILGIPDSLTIICTTGRLTWFKGWEFMIDCFAAFEKINPNSLFYFIGEGEDCDKIKNYSITKGLQSKINLVGKKNLEEIARYLNASDLFIMGSYKEGWSTTLLEALACGVPICTTNFSSAKEIVREGVSGFVEDRNISLFVGKMNKALMLNSENLPISTEIEKYAVSELKNDLLKNWELY